jgi:hypothetical protein
VELVKEAWEGFGQEGNIGYDIHPEGVRRTGHEVKIGDRDKEASGD